MNAPLDLDVDAITTRALAHYIAELERELREARAAPTQVRVLTCEVCHEELTDHDHIKVRHAHHVRFDVHPELLAQLTQLLTEIRARGDAGRLMPRVRRVEELLTKHAPTRAEERRS